MFNSCFNSWFIPIVPLPNLWRIHRYRRDWRRRAQTFDRNANRSFWTNTYTAISSTTSLSQSSSCIFGIYSLKYVALFMKINRILCVVCFAGSHIFDIYPILLQPLPLKWGEKALTCLQTIQVTSDKVPLIHARIFAVSFAMITLTVNHKRFSPALISGQFI